MVFAQVDRCASAMKEFEVVMKLNDYYGKTYRISKKKFATFGVDAAKKVLEECRVSSLMKRQSVVEDATYYLTYYSEGLTFGYSGRTYPYAFVQDTCQNTLEAAEIIDKEIYGHYKGTAKEYVLLYRTTTDLLRNTAVRAASICEDTSEYELMNKAQKIYNKYEK